MNSLKVSNGGIILLNFVFASIIASSSCSYEERIRTESNKIYIKYEHQLKDGTSDFQQIVDISVFYHLDPEDCSEDPKNIYCIKWKHFAQFKIVKVDGNCEDYEFQTELKIPLSVTFNISNVHLYGGAEQNDQGWPVDWNKFDTFSYVSKDENTQAVLEPYWLISPGFYVHVDEKVPLFITLDKDKGIFELIAKREKPYIRDNDTYLKYRVCKYSNMRVAHEHAVTSVLGIPTDAPDYRMVKSPIWSTWAKYKKDITEEKVLEFAGDILKYNFTNSHLEIDDNWETCYGSLTVNTTKFPNMKKLVTDLKSMGFRVTLWIHPFINLDCEPYHLEGVNSQYFVKDTSGSTKTQWWNGDGGQIDFTNPKATSWWQNRVKKLQTDTGVDSFKFDAGESSWSPQVPVFHEMGKNHPETILTGYLRAVSLFGNMVEVRAARGGQKYPIFVRMNDRFTNWNTQRGLSTIIPELLHMNIIGYSFVLPDMIGGNGYHDEEITEEMFIRWLQLNVFMPSIQFSYPPWDYGDRVVKISKKLINLHEKYSTLIHELMLQTTKTGSPVNPPLWWIAPTDPVTYTINSEFLLGENILVAPVIEKGAKSRDIYLPAGIWRDEVNKTSSPIKGPVWLRDYPADLDVLPYFTKVENGAMSLTPMLVLICTTFVIGLIVLFT